MLCDIVGGISKFFSDITKSMGADAVFFIALALQAVIAIFFLVKSLFSYEAKLNRSLEKINYWLFEKKTVTEDNIKELNFLFKSSAPKRVLYYWQQYILFREGAPSSYLSIENLVEKPLKTSSYGSNIKNLGICSLIWALICGILALVSQSYSTVLTGQAVAAALAVPAILMVVSAIFIIFLRYRKSSVLNSLYQNTQLFGRFMDNACVDLPTYIDYQLLFTPQEIENGQPVLREFLDYKARKEKEEFNRAKDDEVQTEQYDFSAVGVDGSMVLDRAMRESETFLKKKERALLKISQLEGELDTRRKNFDNVQKEYQTKIQASKENVDRLRQMQEETTNRIESNYYRKQQTQEIAKQEQLEQEFEQQRAKYSLEKNECEEEIAKLTAELNKEKDETRNAMLSEYSSFFDKFCKSAEKVVAKVFADKMAELKQQNEENKEYITQLEIKLKNRTGNEEVEQGSYDANGNYVYANGTYYDKDGNFHDVEGNVYSQDGKLISKAEKPAQKEKQIVDFDELDAFDFMTDVAQKDDIYGVAENVIKDVADNVEVVNAPSSQPVQTEAAKIEQPAQPEEKPQLESVSLDDFTFDDITPQPAAELVVAPAAEKPSVQPAQATTVRKVGRPKKEVTEQKPKRAVGRPKKIVKEPEVVGPKRGRGRPKKDDGIQQINEKLSAEEKRLNDMRQTLNTDLQNAINTMDTSSDDKIAHREQLIKEIDSLQKEAEQAMQSGDNAGRIEQINSRLEALIKEIQSLN